MKKHFLCLAMIAGLTIIASELAADVHIVAKSSYKWFGREYPSRIEAWISADKDSIQKSYETVIVRRDLGLRWRLNPAKKIYVESLLSQGSSAPSPQMKSQKPETEKKSDDLRFIGHDYQPEYEWSVQELNESATLLGFSCKVFLIKGEADFSHVEIKLWVFPKGKSEGLSTVEEVFNASRWDNEGIEQILKIMAGYPDGGLIKLQQTGDPAIGTIRTLDAEVKTWEKKNPPPGIYEIPEGYKKEEGKKQ